MGRSGAVALPDGRALLVSAGSARVVDQAEETPDNEVVAPAGSLPVQRPAYLDSYPLLPVLAERDLPAPEFEVLFRQVWERRDEPDDFVRLEPYTGGMIRVAQALRHVPDALALSCRLEFGDVSQPEVAYQLTRAVQGIADAATMFDLPVITREFSTEGSRGLHPRIDMGAHGLGPDGQPCTGRASRTGTARLNAGDLLVVAGHMTTDLSGSLALSAMPQETLRSTLRMTNNAAENGFPPPIDLVKEQRLLELVRAARPLLSSATPLGRGGLLITLARSCAESEIGARVALPGSWQNLGMVAALFGEAQSRFLLTLRPEHWPALREAAGPMEVPLHELGEVAGTRLIVAGAISLDLGEVQTWSN